MNDIVMHIFAVAAFIIADILIYLYLLHRTSEKLTIKVFFTFSVEKKYIILCVISFIQALFIYFYSFYHGKCLFVAAFMYSIFSIWLIVIGYIDLKEKIIPNAMILVGIIYWLFDMLIKIFILDANWTEMLKFSGLGAGICGGVLLVVALIVKTALGMGDVKMFFVTGLLFGFADTYSIMLLSMLIMAVLSIILLLMKKVTRKTAVPMAPFVAVGYLLHILLSV